MKRYWLVVAALAACGKSGGGTKHGSATPPTAKGPGWAAAKAAAGRVSK